MVLSCAQSNAILSCLGDPKHGGARSYPNGRGGRVWVSQNAVERA
jgi:hypothetical protein